VARVVEFLASDPLPVVISESPTLGEDAKRLALDRVLNSSTLARSDQLRRFLRYVCEKEISGKTDEISEYLIGIEALGKRPGYSPSEDSSVRTRAHALRQKLQEFYEVEDPGATLRIELPRGNYVPHFLLLTAAIQERENNTDVGLGLPSPSTSSSSTKSFALGAITATLLCAGVFFWIGFSGAQNKIDPLVREAWGGLLKTDEFVDVCVATPPAMLLHSFRDGVLPANPLYVPAPDEAVQWYRGLQMLDGGGNLYMHTTQDVALLGDSLAAISAVHLLTSAGIQTRVVSENDLRPYALRDRNVILIGSPNYSPYAARVLGASVFSVRYDPGSREEVISDHPSDPLKRTVFRPDRDEFGKRTTAYGLITVFPSHGNDEAAETVIFSGISAAGPQAAMEFFKSAVDLRALRSRLAREGYRTFPPAYQVVVRCALDHGLALNGTYVAHRVLQRSPL
jgi:hypothetical protein